MTTDLKSKTLSERIAARAMEKTSRNAKNKAVFGALRDDIKQALDEGWSVKSIWETLNEEGEINFSYQAFCGHVNRSILSTAAAAKSNPKKSKPAGKNPDGPVVVHSTIKGFNYNPVPNLEELFGS